MAHIAHVGRAGHEGRLNQSPSAMNCSALRLYTCQRRRRSRGHIAGQGADLDLGAEGHRTGHQAAVDLGGRCHDGFGAGPAHIGLEAHVGRHHVHQLAALGDDGVDADMIVVLERLAVGVDSLEAQRGRLEGVDPAAAPPAWAARPV